MFQITKYAKVKDSKVQDIVSLESILQIIKRGDTNLPFIQSARLVGKSNPLYDIIKTTSLPTFRFNFLFKDSATNNNITEPTGLIYLDCDNTDVVPDSLYIHAKWKSLSDTGFGILVKVNGLTLENYTDTYNNLSKLIGITSDTGARKVTQQTVLSHDPNLYYNPDSLLFDCTESKKVSCPTIKKKEKCIGTDETFLNKSNNEDTIRFNNIDEYFTGEYSELNYRLFNEKVMICSPFIPNRIEEGNRNKNLFYLLSQYALLNPHVGKSWLRAIAGTINKKMYPNLSSSEINCVIDSVLTKREDNSLELYLNEERRVLYNPKYLFTKQQKMEIVNRELGKLKSDHTKEIIYLVLEDWDFNTNGKITQKKVARLANRGESTVKSYWSEFKGYIKELNNDYKKGFKDFIAGKDPKLNI
ncbi:BT4734/BF3469 family protein [Flavobacterium rakeshii]|uniref:BT4734/BF3469 family protein n=1 Tax=Flavobacterium rakeshii TaxID=1038845 RepID=UPI002E7BFD51|nr:BT4734/BF3469 family protein [Flavobacterium rakeshii]MEE1897446.1 BT4734/BF3469 family protein [Flavobacterium rakeshii]